MKKTQENIIPYRSAFILFKEKGMADVRFEFPQCVKFVEDHKELSIEDVTILLAKKLDAFSNKVKRS